MLKEGSWEELTALNIIKDQYDKSTDINPLHGAVWMDLAIAHPKIARSHQFYSFSFSALVSIKDNVQLLRQHTTYVLELVLNYWRTSEFQIADIRIVDYFINVVQLVIPENMHYRVCKPEDHKIDPIMLTLIETILKLWIVIMKLGPTISKTFSSHLIKNNHKTIIRRLLFCIDLSLSPFRSITDTEIRLNDVNSLEGVYGISYQVAEEYSSLVNLVLNILFDVEWMLLHHKQIYEDVFTDAERCYMVLILRGIFNLKKSNPDVIPKKNLAYLIPLAIIASLDQLPCQKMNEDQFAKFTDIEMSQVSSCFLKLQLIQLVDELDCNNTQVTKTLYYDWISSYCRKLLRLAIEFQMRISDENKDYLESFFQSIPNITEYFDENASTEEILNGLELQNLIVKYLHGTKYCDYQMLRKLIEGVMKAWSSHSHNLIIDPTEDSGRTMVLFDAIEYVILLVNRLQEKNVAIDPLTTDVEKYFMKNLLFEVWYAVGKAGSKKLDISQTTVLKAIKCLCDSLYTLVNRSVGNPLKNGQLISFLVQMTQTNVKRVTKHNLAGLIDDSLWIFKRINKSIKPLKNLVKVSFRKFLQFCCENIPKNLPNRPAYERALDFLDRKESRDIIGSKMVHKVRADVEYPLILQPTSTNKHQSSTQNQTTTTLNGINNDEKQNISDKAEEHREQDNHREQFSETTLPKQDNNEENETLDLISTKKSILTTKLINNSPIGQDNSTTFKSECSFLAKEDPLISGDDDELLIVRSATRKRRTCTPRCTTMNSEWSDIDSIIPYNNDTPLRLESIKRKRTEEREVDAREPVHIPEVEYPNIKRAVIVDQLLSGDNIAIKQAVKKINELLLKVNEELKQIVTSPSFIVAFRIALGAKENIFDDEICLGIFQIILKLLEFSKNDDIITNLLLKHGIIDLVVSRIISVSFNYSTMLLDVLILLSKDEIMFSTLNGILQEHNDHIGNYLQGVLRIESDSVGGIEANINKVKEFIVTLLKSQLGKTMVVQLRMDEILLKSIQNTAQMMQHNSSTYVNIMKMLCELLSTISTHISKT